MHRNTHPLVSLPSSFLSSFFVIALLLFGLLWYYSKLWTFNTGGRGLVVAFGFLLLSDGLYLLIHAFLRPHRHTETECAPRELTVVLATYNGADIIERTIEGAHRHVPLDQIIVVSDTSTDHTAALARSLGARVQENEVNLNKALTISRISTEVNTPYTLILDDDTYIGNTVIPTSVLGEGYDAVAFNVMPESEPTLVNKLQQYEYRKAMFLGKRLRAGSASVGNVSGAIGLYHTKDIQFQRIYHSGLFGGEDQERTSLAYLYGAGRGVTYTDSLVTTETPHTWKQLFRQRGVKFGGGWGAAHVNILVLYLRLLVSRRAKFALKFEKAYQVFIVLSDPLRLILFPLFVIDPGGFAMAYAAYTALEVILWFWTKRKDRIWIVLLSPLYGMFNTIARFVSIPFWIKNRYEFVFKKKFHRFITGRSLIAEYTGIVVVLIALWTLSVIRFLERMF